MNSITKSALLISIAAFNALTTTCIIFNTSDANAVTIELSKKGKKPSKVNKKLLTNYIFPGKKCGKVSFYYPERNAMGGISKVGSAASKTLPFGTKLKITTKKGQVFNVTIDDRGPYVKGRDLDIVSNNPTKLGVQSACWESSVVTKPIEEVKPIVKDEPTTPIKQEVKQLPPSEEIDIEVPESDSEKSN
jgi:rare lipoprotein A (peptidoglycan hydrolase)